MPWVRRPKSRCRTAKKLGLKVSNAALYRDTPSDGHDRLVSCGARRMVKEGKPEAARCLREVAGAARPYTTVATDLLPHTWPSIHCQYFVKTTVHPSGEPARFRKGTGEGRREKFSQLNFSKFFYITFFENEFLGPSISRKLNFSE